MVKRILVPVDGSDTSEAIFPHLRSLLKRVDADLTLIHVCTKSAREQRSGHEYLEDLTERLADQFPVVTPTLVLGEVGPRIIQAAVKGKFDLIAMTTHGRSGLSKMLYGSVADDLLASSPVPLLLARPDAPVGEYKTILVPLDGSKRSEMILPLVIELGKASAGSLVFLAAGVKRATQHLQDACGRAVDAGVAAEAVSLDAKPAEAILATAANRKADLIAISTHGRSGKDRKTFGSVTEKILKQAKLPLLVKRTAGAIDIAGHVVVDQVLVEPMKLK